MLSSCPSISVQAKSQVIKAPVKTYKSHMTIHLTSTAQSSKTESVNIGKFTKKDDGDVLPAVNFSSHKIPCSTKRKADSSLTGLEKMRHLFEEIENDKNNRTHLSPLKEIHIDTFSSSESEQVTVDRVILNKQKSTLVKKSIDMEKLLQYVKNNVYDILALPFSFKDKQFEKDLNAQEYLETYEEETEAVQAELTKHDANFKIMNVKFLDRLLWLSAKTVERYLKEEIVDMATRKTAETSPKRKEIRDTVRKNSVIAAQRMKDRYSKSKRLIVKEFRIGDTVAVRVPIEDRAKTDARRIPAIIVKVKGTTYKLACRYGTISGYYSTSNLIPFPGCVAIANEDVEISLRTAAKQHSQRKSDIFFCKCKKSCKSKHCTCLKRGLSCNGRCHSGKPCKNIPTTKESTLINSNTSVDLFIKYGGHFGKEHFSNTCSIDNWLAMLCLTKDDYRESFENLMNVVGENNPDFTLLLQLILDGKIMQSKFQLAFMNQLAPKHETYDFYGNENKFINQCKFMMKYEGTSTCSNDCCQNGLLKQ